MASAAVIVQFVRNLGCVVRSLCEKRWCKNATELMVFEVAGKSITAVNCVIAPTQFAAAVFNLLGGIKDTSRGLKEVTRYRAWAALIPKRHPKDEAESLLYASIRQKLTSAYLLVLQGVLSLAFAVCFCVLGLNTLQLVTPKLVFDALAVMDIGLLFFLWLMWRKYADHLTDSTRCNKLADLLDAKAGRSNTAVLDLAREAGFSAASMPLAFAQIMPKDHISSWTDDSVSPSSSALSHAIFEVQSDLNSFEDASSRAPQKQQPTGDTPVSAGRVCRSNAAYKLHLLAYEGSQEWLMDLVYFVLNFIAFYGYMLSILKFYSEFYSIDRKAQWHHMLKFGMSHEDSDWWGNFAGDMAWTIEPLLVMVIAYMTSGASIWATLSGNAEANVKSPGSVRFAATASEDEGRPRGRATVPTPWKPKGSGGVPRGGAKSRSRSPSASRSKSPAAGKRGGGSSASKSKRE